MQTLEYLRDPVLRAVYLPGVLAGLATVIMCGLVSPLVVVKRLGFIGQGISHCAFGGVGVASLLAAMGFISLGGTAEFAVIGAFCIAAALGMGVIAERRRTSEDTTIGLFLVGSMATGALLVAFARDLAVRLGRTPDGRSWESILFGQVTGAGPTEVWLAFIVLALVALAVFGLRRPLLFWAFDEDAARAFGVPTGAMKAALMIILALVVVTAMRTAGVVLASALLVLPGATALKLSRRFKPVVALACLIGVVGLFGGLVLSFENNWQPGPCVVLVMVAMFAAAWARERLAGAASQPPAATVRA